METKIASYFKEMEFARQHTFEGGRIQGGKPGEEIYTAVMRTFFTKEKYTRLFQYTERLRMSDKFIVAGEYWLRDDLTIWKVPLYDDENFSLSKARRLNSKEAIEVLTQANSNGTNPEWDELMDFAIAAND